MANDFVPANDLEEALIRAARDPAARPEFYRRLLDAKLFFLTPDVPDHHGSEVLKVGRSIALTSFEGPNGPYTPFFSSEARVGEVARQMQARLGFRALRGGDAFGLLAQGTMEAVLNPGFPYGKAFTADEIRQLAARAPEAGQTITVEKETKVLLGQPSQYPQALVDALVRLFAGQPSVEAAYLAQIHDPSSDLPPHPVIGIVSTEFRQVVRDAGIVANSVASGPVDFVEVEPVRPEGLTEYLLGTKPFYERKTKPRWKFW